MTARLWISAPLLIIAFAAVAETSMQSDGTLPPERSGTSIDDPRQRARDLTGRSIKTPRVRAMHSTDPDFAGGTANLFARDPWLAYQRGRELFLREFSAADGAFGGAGKGNAAGPPLEDGATRMLTGSHVASCALCHNTPFRDAGAGATIFKNGGSGRNTQHLFGAGLVEMLGWQIRQKLLALGDTNGNGFIDRGESSARRAAVENLPSDIAGDRQSVDFGSFGDADNDGRPDLNPVCFIWYVDADGRRLPAARSLSDAGVAGYSFEVQVFGWGHGEWGAGRVPLSSTLRGFSAGAFHLHAGMQPVDPTLSREPGRDGLTLVSLAGAQQFYTAKPLDRGRRVNAIGASLDDPDGDGVIEELTEGDMDLVEFYQLNHPAPAETRRTPRRERGRELFAAIGCAACHVPDWQIDAAKNAAGRPLSGDRRFFHLRVEPARTGRLEGTLERRATRGGAFTVRGIYSDFAYHDLGPAFHQIQFDGTVVKRFKTAPLWGVGSSAPYGHDGASLDIESVIRRHGGEAQASADRFAALDDDGRDAVLSFLNGLVLYAVDELPCDVDGDGRIAKHFIVAGQDTGIERLNPEWLFRVPGRIEGEVRTPGGGMIRSFALTNMDAAYGCDLPGLADRDRDGFPDVRTKQP